jgi:VIT1/CCC1 family predicted Fe2+/Mn2+ transporter
MPAGQIERHRAGRTGWLRAAVLGADDGILSTASLVLGVAAANGSRNSVLIAGIAGLVAGAMSMAAGEYVSVHSQKDTEKADLALERRELRADDGGEHKELEAIYVGRGLDRTLGRLPTNLWPMTLSARMPETNSASRRPWRLVRSRRRWRRP